MASRGPLLALCAVLFLAHCVAADWSQVYPSGYAPAARKFHSAVMQGSDVFFFGGTDGAQSFNDTFSWNIESSSVTLYTPASSSPKERHLHSAVQLAASATHPSGAMVIFAGHLYAGVAFANDMWAWDYAASTWTEVIYNNSPPPPRAAHAAALQGTLMYVYGGTGPNATDSSAPNITYDDLWVFNMTSRLWTQLQTTADIGPRTGIVGGMHGHTMYLYGGQDGKGYPYGDFWALDTSHLEWTLLFEPGEHRWR